MTTPTRCEHMKDFRFARDDESCRLCTMTRPMAEAIYADWLAGTQTDCVECGGRKRGCVWCGRGQVFKAQPEDVAAALAFMLSTELVEVSYEVRPHDGERSDTTIVSPTRGYALTMQQARRESGARLFKVTRRRRSAALAERGGR